MCLWVRMCRFEFLYLCGFVCVYVGLGWCVHVYDFVLPCADREVYVRHHTILSVFDRVCLGCICLDILFGYRVRLGCIHSPSLSRYRVPPGAFILLAYDGWLCFIYLLSMYILTSVRLAHVILLLIYIYLVFSMMLHLVLR